MQLCSAGLLMVPTSMFVFWRSGSMSRTLGIWFCAFASKLLAKTVTPVQNNTTKNNWLLCRTTEAHDEGTWRGSRCSLRCLPFSSALGTCDLRGALRNALRFKNVSVFASAGVQCHPPRVVVLRQLGNRVWEDFRFGHELDCVSKCDLLQPKSV